MNAFVWTLQVLLAALFLFAGGMKLVMPVEQLVAQSGMPGAFLQLIGVAEVLGGLGLVLPGLSGIRTGLTPLAAAGLVIIMIGAVVTTVAEHGVATALIPLTTGLALAFVGYARWRLVPLASPSRAGAPASAS